MSIVELYRSKYFKVFKVANSSPLIKDCEYFSLQISHKVQAKKKDLIFYQLIVSSPNVNYILADSAYMDDLSPFEVDKFEMYVEEDS